jgi:hypothetical protein
MAVCNSHGGRSPQAKRKAAERLAEARARAELERWRPDDPEPLADPYDALLRLAAQADDWRKFLAVRVAELQDELRYGHRAGEQVRAEIVLFGQAMDRCAKILESIAKLNIAERQVRVREAEVLLMAEGIRAILRDLDLDERQRQLASVSVPRRLRELEGQPSAVHVQERREPYVGKRRPTELANL